MIKNPSILNQWLIKVKSGIENYEFAFINTILYPTFKNKYIFENKFFNCLQFEFSRIDTMIVLK